MHTILGANGTIARELGRQLPALTAEPLRLVSRRPQAVNPTDELWPADLTDAARTARAVAGSSVAYLVAGLPYNTATWQRDWPRIAVLLDAQGQVVRGRPAPGQPVQVLVDGGLLANYPIDLFDYPRYLPAGTPAAPDARGRVFNPETLGLRLDRAEQIALDTAATGRQQLAPYAIHDFGSYVGALYTVALENLNPAQPADRARTVSISTRGFNPKIKRVSAAQKQELLESGRQGVLAFLAR